LIRRDIVSAAEDILMNSMDMIKTLLRKIRAINRIVLELEAARLRADIAEGELIKARQESRNIISTLGRSYFEAFLRASEGSNFILVELNNTTLWLPVDTLRTMVHCLVLRPDGSLGANVEESHLHWMMRQLEGGGTFLDVGAATGATTLPIASHLGAKVRMVAYEPARAARHLLLATLDRNSIAGVTVRPVAVSDRVGEVEFREYFHDETGHTPFMPEASSIVATLMTSAPHETINVQVVTLDEDALPLLGTKPIVCKIDVEGFEAFVLRGAARLLSAGNVYLSIDIHRDPFGDGEKMTETDVRDVLLPYRYSFERMGHVLLCSPDS
jgi:FkbM family methyltransferase